MASGYISVYRQIQDHWLWKGEAFSRGQAWIDLLLMANHQDGKMYFNGKLIDVQRGEVITSEVKLSERWKWSRTKVRSFLKTLSDEHMIEQKKDSKKTDLIISNYAEYQTSQSLKKTVEKPQKNNEKTSEKHQKNTINNDNNDNNIFPPIIPQKKKYAEYVEMTNAEYAALISDCGETDTKRMIEILDNYKGSKGRKYKSDYRAIRNWVVTALAEEKRRRGNNSNLSIYEDDNINYDELEKIMQEKM